MHSINPPTGTNWTTLPEEEFTKKFGTFVAGDLICELIHFDFTGWEITMIAPQQFEGIATKGDLIVYLENYRDRCVYKITNHPKESP